MNIKHILVAGSALIFSTLSYSSTTCIQAMDFVNGCQIDYFSEDPSNEAVLTATLVISQPDLPTFNALPTTEAAALEAMTYLAIAVDGLSDETDIYVKSQQLSTNANTTVIIIDYSVAGTVNVSIEDLAAVFQKTLTIINTLRGDDASPTAILGASLGGVFSRYALASMEAQNLRHNAHLYASYETPHRGVYVPQSIQNIPTMLQWSNNTLNDVLNGLSSGPIKVNLSLFGLELNQTLVDTNQAIIDNIVGVSISSKIAKQLLIDNVYASGTEFEDFFTQYHSMGLPNQTGSNIAISNGTFNGTGQSAWNLLNGKFYHFQGRIGDYALVKENLPVGGQYAQANFELYPTAAGQKNITAGVTWTRKDLIFFVTNYATLGASKNYTTPSTAKEYDTVPGGWLDFSEYLSGANDVFEAASDYVTVRHEPISQFAFVPTYSALDIDYSYGYDQPVPANTSPFDQTISMSSQFSGGNGAHSDVRITTELSEIVENETRFLSINDRVVLWLSDIDAAASCIECHEDDAFVEIVICKTGETPHAGCLTNARRAEFAEIYSEDLYYHAIDYGFTNINSMFDARFEDEDTFTTQELIERIRLHVVGLDMSYWNSFTRSSCNAMDTHGAHTDICNKLPL